MKRLLIPAAAVLLQACASTNIEAPAELVDFVETASFEETWSAEIGGLEADLRLGLAPASDGENVYVADHEGGVHAFRLADGEKLWEFDTSDFRLWGDSIFTPFSAGPAVADGRVVVGSLDGDVLALDAASGEKLWQKNVEGELLAKPLMGAGLAVLRTTDGRIIALDAATGERRWDTVREVPVLTIRGHATPAGDGSRIVVGLDNGKVAALSAEDGSMLWETTVAIPAGASELEEIVDVDGDLAYFGSEIYATSYNGNLAALAVESGDVLWRQELSSVLAPVVAYGEVFVTDTDSVVRGFERLSGAPTWTQDKLRARYLTGPALLGDLLAVGDFAGYVHFLDVFDGHMVARIEHSGEPVRARPLVVDDSLIVLSDDGELAVYRRTDAEAE
ncbi:MAG TPA: outer membrane protein assembly factor BamB [Gammaproteobacteria bacterium]